MFCAAFCYLEFGFVILNENNIGTKADRKILVKLTKCWLLETQHEMKNFEKSRSIF